MTIQKQELPMNGAQIVSGIPGRAIEAGDDLERRPPSAASKADETSPIQPGAGA